MADQLNNEFQPDPHAILRQRRSGLLARSYSPPRWPYRRPLPPIFGSITTAWSKQFPLLCGQPLSLHRWSEIAKRPSL